MSAPPLAAFSPTEFTIPHEESVEHNIALSIFVSYFAITFVLFRVVSLSLADAYKRAKREGERATLDATLSLKESSDIWVTWKRKLVRMKTFLVIALLSYLHTWFYMLKFLYWSFTNFESSNQVIHYHLKDRVTTWLVNTDLFEQAWAEVCKTAVNWWWSEQLCLFTVSAWSLFLCYEGRRRNIKYLASYMLLGQLVAISVASSLFYAAVCLCPEDPSLPSRFDFIHRLDATKSALTATAPKEEVKKSKSKSKTRAQPKAEKKEGEEPIGELNYDDDEECNALVSPKLYICTILGLFTVTSSPFTTPRNFLVNLLFMHALPFIPLLSNDRGLIWTHTKSTTPAGVVTVIKNPDANPYKSIPIKVVLTHATLISYIIRLRFAQFMYTTVFPKLPMPFYESIRYMPIVEWASKVWKVLHEHPAQSSIGWDIIWTTLGLAMWGVFKDEQNEDFWFAAVKAANSGGRDGHDDEREWLDLGKKGRVKGDGEPQWGLDGLGESDEEEAQQPPPPLTKPEIREWTRRRWIMQRRWFHILYVLFATPVASLGVTAPYIYRYSVPDRMVPRDPKEIEERDAGKVKNE